MIFYLLQDGCVYIYMCVCVIWYSIFECGYTILGGSEIPGAK